ncbi:MAG: tyrosine-type recombinase/integrase [Gemmatimonadota bacterium]|nr:MAG: tyrosine-type recombinase/integrase [Gemmatimonadota bacterium]
MAHRTSKGGSYRIDRMFPGVGRIAIASGATTKAGFKARNGLLTRLYDKGRLDILRAIKAGETTLTEVLEADRSDDLDSLTGDRRVLSQNLWDAVEAWLPKSAASRETRRRYEVSFAKLRERSGLKATATVADLEKLDWKRIEKEWPGSNADYNHAWRAVSKFLSDTMGDVHHPFRRRVMKEVPKRKEVERVPDINPELFWRVVNAAPEFVRAAFVLLALTGLRVGEYLRLTKQDLLPSVCGIRVPGTKTAESAATVYVDERMWPWIEAAVPAPVKYGWLRKYWKRALNAAKADETLRLHDLRHCTGQWAINEGVQEAKVQATLRHTTPEMTRRYTRQKDKGEVATAVANVMLRTAS